MWGAQTHALAAATAERLRQQMLDLVGRAYSTIALSKLAVLLGCSEDEAAQGEAAAGLLRGGAEAGRRLCAVEEAIAAGLVYSCSADRTAHRSARGRTLPCSVS